MLILYDGTTSVCAIKVRITLVEKGLDFQSRNIDLRKGEQFSSDYLQLNPNAVVPTLVDGENIVLESSIIMQYLEDLIVDNSLLPESPQSRAKMRMWLKRIDDLEVKLVEQRALLDKQLKEIEGWKKRHLLDPSGKMM